MKLPRQINADGTAAMLRDPELRRALINDPAHQAVLREYELEPFELFDSWVKSFLDLYETYPEKKADPALAIVDYLENATLRDFEEFARRFQAAGIRCEIRHSSPAPASGTRRGAAARYVIIYVIIKKKYVQ